jgi:uncharacterized protein
MRGRILFFVIGVFAAAGAIWLFLYSSFPKTVSFHGKVYSLEIAATEEERALGLGERDSLCATCGMLFVFEEPAQPGFWMKGMRFPLDIAWLLDDTVVHVERHIPFDDKATYRPPVPANRVLEFRAGTLDDVTVGERVEFSR